MPRFLEGSSKVPEPITPSFGAEMVMPSKTEVTIFESQAVGHLQGHEEFHRSSDQMIEPEQDSDDFPRTEGDPKRVTFSASDIHIKGERFPHPNLRKNPTIARISIRGTLNELNQLDK
ncbi:MAG: hypothetical protein KBD46_03400 [Candidatus Levybacteria bacterium]|nr:hypothetical protein [Candidatus Levybacteria bacterium]